MKAVIVDGDVSYPPTNGKRIRTLHPMLRMARRHQVTYFCRGNGDADESARAAAYLRDHGVEPVIVEHPRPRKSGPRFYGQLALNLLSPLPYTIAAHHSPAVLR